MQTHLLKTWPEYFRAIADGSKTFEARVNDRDYQPGDRLDLREYDPTREVFTGARMIVETGDHLSGGQFGIEPGHVVMSIVRKTKVTNYGVACRRAHGT